jgi:catechol-2,3-dioxygenase
MADKQVLRGLSTISFFSVDHAAAKKWYAEFLGIEPYFERPGYAEFRIGDHQHELGIINSKYVPSTDSSQGRAGVVAYWHVDDVNATLKARYLDGRKAARSTPRPWQRVCYCFRG